MKADELRERYLEFFESHGCVRRPSDVLVPKDDKTILFTPAGMNQFKNQFLGIGPLEFTRATTCQKCLRTGDIDNVGVTAYHHTFFEMLGNFSFGDYFKQEAIHWAWEFCTSRKWLNLDRDRLRVTVYLDDDEAYAIWRNEIGLPADKISRENENENFWPAGAPTHGPDGVCGPCSEIYFHPPGQKSDVEIWNLVFTQFNRVGDPPDNLRPLPKKNIDTGMGLERTAAVLQGVVSNFEIDLLRPIVLAAADAVGVKYDFDAPQGRPLRRICDHVRAVTFCVHEGVAPGNEKQGYIVRQLLRRAVLEGYLLGRHEPFLYQVAPAVVAQMKAAYPEIAQTLAAVQDTIRTEEEQFLGTVERGVRKFQKLIEACARTGTTWISAADAFDLHQTDGFLIELTQSMAARHNLKVDRKGFDALMDEHRGRSGKGAFAGSVMAAGPLAALHKTTAATEFLGYDATAAEAAVVGLIAEEKLVEEVDDVGHVDPVGVVLDRTPFYGEAGGQVGDTGKISGEGLEFEVHDTQRDGALIIHVGRLLRGKLRLGLTVQAEVDAARRAGIRRAHTATHLLHHALQKVLGSHAMQRGSKVENDLLRFDFTQPKPVTREQLEEIEEIIQARVVEGAPVRADVMELEAAKKAGATALFGEKYPDRVRVVSMGEFSKELCGGTHLANTGQVGLCRVLSEESVAKGVRRITAVTGPRALAQVRETEALLRAAAAALKAPRLDEVPKKIEALHEELRRLKLEAEKQHAQSAVHRADALVENARTISGVRIIVAQVDLPDVDGLRALVDQLRRKASPSAAVLLASAAEGKVTLIAGLTPEAMARGLHAGDLVKAAAQAAGGGGGGRPDLAQAGGKDPSRIPAALEAGMAYLAGKLG